MFLHFISKTATAPAEATTYITGKIQMFPYKAVTEFFFKLVVTCVTPCKMLCGLPNLFVVLSLMTFSDF